VDLSPLNWLVAGPDASLRANRRGLGKRVRGTTSFTKTAEMKRAYGGTKKSKDLVALANPTLLLNIDGEGTMEVVLSDGSLEMGFKSC